ncbi:glycine cleavage system protein GcvH [Pseudomonas sp. LPB0260]|uniref:glycine cleavage system protein GcvH n=1 Tax=Pseudomonas sp. LPB0260 TaxID=2614442 RepID=UPI0015C25CEA|nr:glycine cleavage system protein GcvH [Pseudomonas sp. LPB0260]QLC73923.1 glycine cleavage system protein GcvH [Pseudomonas sp. LPB0260]QLC76697.1 glycine cleavage system protein GcvH [Pseudomonas sp. LPB0260]
MSELRFTVDHEWLRQDADGLVTVGITAYAQEALGDVVFVQLPEAQGYAQGDEVAVLESVKAASNIAMPLDGEIVEVNAELEGSPELVNEDPLNKGWFFRFRPTDASAVAALLDQDAYQRLLKANDEA